MEVAAESIFSNPSENVSNKRTRISVHAVKTFSQSLAEDAPKPLWDELQTKHSIDDMVMCINNTEKTRLDTQDEWGRRALHWAAYYANIPLVEALLEKGSEKDILDNSEKTPLDLAKEGKRSPQNIFRSDYNYLMTKFNVIIERLSDTNKQSEQKDSSIAKDKYASNLETPPPQKRSSKEKNKSYRNLLDSINNVDDDDIITAFQGA